MRFVLCFLAILAVASDASAQRRSRTREYHAVTVTPNSVQTVDSYRHSGPVVSSSGAVDALDEVNAARARRGLPPYVRDESLAIGAMRLAEFRAARGIFGHTPNDFALVPGSASATGCAAYHPSMGWLSCCTYDGYRFAGAAWAIGSDGRRYMHLVVR